MIGGVPGITAGEQSGSNAREFLHRAPFPGWLLGEFRSRGFYRRRGAPGFRTREETGVSKARRQGYRGTLFGHDQNRTGCTVDYIVRSRAEQQSIKRATSTMSENQQVGAHFLGGTKDLVFGQPRPDCEGHLQ